MLQVFTTLANTSNKIQFWGRQHAPEILMVTSIVSGIGCVVAACVATAHMQNVVGEAQAEIDAIEDTKNKQDVNGDYTDDQVKKDKRKVYAKAIVETTTLYLPAIALGACSVASVLGGFGILNKRNASLAAGLAASTASIKELRDRIIERYGLDAYNELKYGVKSLESKEKVTDENGKTKTIKTNVMVSDENAVFEGYQRRFDSSNPYWDKDIACNWMFVRFRQNYWNDKLRADKYVFLNEVLESLGFPKTRAGQEVGWVYDPDNPNIDNYIDFGAFEVVLNELGGHRAILLDFNVDGSVINKAKWDEQS